MSRIDDAIEQLASRDEWGYREDGPAAAEPTALAALALASHGQLEAAKEAANWLAERQTADGSVGITAGDSLPSWPTPLAVLAWLAVANAPSSQASYGDRVARAIDSILATEGLDLPPSWRFGHDTSLVGWPWVVGTHGWVVPTAWSILALKAAGQDDHPRTRDGVAMLFDRLLPDGGANYGNTIVLGRLLRPQLEPTGIALLALAGEKPPDERLARAADYALRSLPGTTASVSLAWAILGVTAQGLRPADSILWLESAAERTLQTDPSPMKLALLALAALPDGGPLVRPSGRSEIAWETSLHGT